MIRKRGLSLSLRGPLISYGCTLILSSHLLFPPLSPPLTSSGISSHIFKPPPVYCMPNFLPYPRLYPRRPLFSLPTPPFRHPPLALRVRRRLWLPSLLLRLTAIYTDSQCGDSLCTSDEQAEVSLKLPAFPI